MLVSETLQASVSAAWLAPSVGQSVGCKKEDCASIVITQMDSITFIDSLSTVVQYIVRCQTASVRIHKFV